MVVFSPSFAGASRPPVQQFRGQTALPASQPVQDSIKFGKNDKRKPEVVLNKYLPGYEDKWVRKKLLIDALDIVPGLGDVLTFVKTRGLTKDAKALGASRGTIATMNVATLTEAVLDLLLPTVGGAVVDETLPTTTLLTLLVRKIAMDRAQAIAARASKSL